MSTGKHTVGKNGTAEAARIANLERRLLNSEAAEQRVQTELLKACEGAEAAQHEAAKTWKLQEEMQVITSHKSISISFMSCMRRGARGNLEGGGGGGKKHVIM